MKIGLAVPVHVNDAFHLENYCFPSILNLDPKPDIVVLDVNNGAPGGLKEIKTRLYDKCFNKHGCDIVLHSDSDFQLFKGILKHVRREVLVNFNCLVKTPVAAFLRLLEKNVARRPWEGCYSIPREVWFNQVRDNPLFDGSDTGVKQSIEMNYHTVRRPQFMLTRRSTKAFRKLALYHPLNVNKHFFEKMARIGLTIGV